MVLGKLDIYMQKNECEPLTHTTIKKTSKWNKDLNIRAKIIIIHLIEPQIVHEVSIIPS